MKLSKLKRYSKPRGAGDQTSGGRGKLLRPSTDLTRIGIVVRETLQNSWDARDSGWYPAYGMRVYRVDDDTRNVLSNCVFTDLPESLGDLAKSLRDPNLHAIEIFDRGTSGLSGPFRASDEASPDGPNRFNSFVFDIGTTNSSATSGGTFGFGKTATFEVSRVHSVVYWTRCVNEEGEYEHRLIAASLHEPFSHDGARFTGAHWWGDPSVTQIVPLRGDDAQILGEALFHLHFGQDGQDQETGTSILVLDPVISIQDFGDDPDHSIAPMERVPVRTEAHVAELLQQISDALTQNIWPKTIPADASHAPMVVELYRDEENLNVADRIRNEASDYANALRHVRRAQGQQTDDAEDHKLTTIVYEETFPIQLRPRYKTNTTHSDFFGDRRDNIIGHLHMSAGIKTVSAGDSPIRDNALCLMRSEAELVVCYDEVIESSDDLLKWHGVFKPTPECDHHFSACEPPTHDSWNPRSGSDNEISTYIVEKALGQIRRKAREFLAAHNAPQRASTRSVRGVANGLREFVPFGALDEGNGTPSSGGPRKPRRNPTPSSSTNLEILNSQVLSDAHGQQLQVLASAPNGTRIRASVAVHALTPEGRMALNDSEVEVFWRLDSTNFIRGAVTELDDGTIADLIIRTQTIAALEIDLRTEATT